MAEAAPPDHPQPPRPPPSNSQQLSPHPAAAHKRMLEVEEFKQTSYYKIRTIVRDLRASFLEACRAPNLQNSKAVDEVQKKLKSIAELYRHVGTERASSRSLHTSSAFAQDFYKQQHHQQQQIPSQAKADYKQKANLPSETLQHNLNTNTRSSEMASSTATQPGSGSHPPRTATNTTLPGATSIEQMLGGGAATKGTYVVGGSPLGWNFVAYHTSATPVYGGVSKAEWLSKRAAVAAAAAGTAATNTVAASSAAAGTTATNTVTVSSAADGTTATNTVVASSAAADPTVINSVTASQKTAK